MHGSVFLDAANGEVIRPALFLCDQRTGPVRLDPRGGWGGPRRRGDLQPCSDGFTALKIIWLRQHEPENYRRMAKCLLPKPTTSATALRASSIRRFRRVRHGPVQRQSGVGLRRSSTRPALTHRSSPRCTSPWCRAPYPRGRSVARPAPRTPVVGGGETKPLGALVTALSHPAL